MPFSGNGAFRLAEAAFVTQTGISATVFNLDIADIEAALTTTYRAMPAFTDVTNQTFRQSGALAVVGRSANSTGDVADIQATAASDQVLRESGSVLGFGTVATAGIANSAVTNAKLANMAANTLKGRAVGAGTGVPVDLTAAQAIAILNIPRNIRVFTSSGTYPTVTQSLRILVYCKGGGGGGGGGAASSTGGGGGGGEGEESWGLFSGSQLSGQTVTVGAGGAGVLADRESTGSAGDTTSIGSLITAVGGLGGTPRIFGGAGGAGGNGGTNTWGFPGEPGLFGTNTPGGTVQVPGKGGGKGGGVVATAGVANSGGGGGSGHGTAASGAGGSGIVIAFEYGSIT